jgi:hypothetical protein
MARTGFRRSVLAASLACGAMAVAPGVASAQSSLLGGLTGGLTGAGSQGQGGGGGYGGSFNCDASALRISLLGSTLLEPVTANRGSTDCQNDAHSLLTLPPPLNAKVVYAQTGVDTDTRSSDGWGGTKAGAEGGIANLGIGMGGLQAALNQSLQQLVQPLVNAMQPITIPLLGGSGSGTTGSVTGLLGGTSTSGLLGGTSSVTGLLGGTSTGSLLNNLPGGLGTALSGLTSITIDPRPAVQSLLTNLINTNTDLLDLQVATSEATAKCVNGQPDLDGQSQLANLSLLGQQLPLDQAVTQAITLLNTQNIDLSNLDLSMIQLPAGLNLSALQTSTLLQSVIKPVLAALPPLQIPAQIAQISIVPKEQTITTDPDGTKHLTQDALHVHLSALGMPLLDAVLGEARISSNSVSCDYAHDSSASQLALQCTQRKLTLIDVLQNGNHVDFYGAADKSLVGQTVGIVFNGGSKVIATAKVGADGLFRTTGPLPPQSIRFSNTARYQAVDAAGERSLNLKLHRRMLVDSITSSGGQVHITGTVTGPLADPVQSITIQRRVSCTTLVNVTTVHPDKNGHWSATVAPPPHSQAAVYRATTAVRKNMHNPKRFPTFTLPRVVEING